MISFYTLEKGKVEALARGVKKILSKNAAALEPFCFVEAEIIPGKEIARLGSVTPINIFKNIRADLEKSLLAAYAVNLLDKVTHPHEPDPRIFKLLVSWLEWLDSAAVIPAMPTGRQAQAGIQGDNKSVWIPAFAGMTIDVFVIKLFYLLGFDITKVKNIPLSARRELAQLLKEKWGVKCHPERSEGSMAALRQTIYRFAVYHSERKLGDWGKILNVVK